MTQRERFETDMAVYLEDREIRFFTAREMCAVGRSARNGRGEVATLKPPPLILWPNIVETVTAADWLRDALGVPLVVTSGYRSGHYNRVIGGVQGSQHVTFRALDLHCPTRSPRELSGTMEEYPHADKMGIGTYPTRGFIHIDSRGAKARWEE